MSNPLIIFGAGASYDYSSLGTVAPLTNDLVADNFLFTDLLEKYRGSGDLLSDVVSQVRQQKKSFEAVLTELKARTAHSPQMRKQFAALEFYLKALFKRISTPNEQTRRMYQINNYRTIINRIHTYSQGNACVVTFNYDTLFEHNFGSEAPVKMQDYVSGKIKIIKLHGSHDWVYVQARSLMDRATGTNETDDYEWYLKNPEFTSGLQTKSDVSPYHQQELQEISDRNNYAWFPAIAVPLTGKDKYICPSQHIQALERLLPTVDRILIIGWKAGDPLLLDTLAKHLPKMGYKVLIVSNSLDSAKEIGKVVKEKLSAHEGQIETRGGGFSYFVSDDISHTFFSE